MSPGGRAEGAALGQGEAAGAQRGARGARAAPGSFPAPCARGTAALFWSSRRRVAAGPLTNPSKEEEGSLNFLSSAHSAEGLLAPFAAQPGGSAGAPVAAGSGRLLAARPHRAHPTGLTSPVRCELQLCLAAVWPQRSAGAITASRSALGCALPLEGQVSSW